MAEITIEYKHPKNQRYEQMRQSAMQQQMIEKWMAKLNPHFVGSLDLDIYMLECGQANAFYAAQTHEILMCYEMLEKVNSLTSEHVSAKDAPLQAGSAWTFMFYHEFGHAITDLFDLPVVGREEDAVDQFATLFAIEGTESAREQIALSGAFVFWWLLPTQDQIGWQFGFSNDDKQKSYADTHGLGQQRFYNIVCMLYGHNSSRYQRFVSQYGYVPQQLHPEKAKYCSADYQQIRRRWAKLSKGYFEW
jgi:hypothetical protein